MKRSGWRVVVGVLALLAVASCEFGVAPEEAGTTSSITSRTATLEAPVGARIGEGAASWIPSDDPAQPAGAPQPAETPVQASPVSCAPNPVGQMSVCLPAPQTGGRGHGDPQPWQPAPVPQPY